MKEKERLPLFWQGVVGLIYVLAAVGCAGLVGMMLVIFGDVVLRVSGHPVKGAYDVVRLLGVVTIVCSVPLTTALKGHVALEYFFHKLGRSWRIAVDSVMRLVMIGSFVLAAIACAKYGTRLLQNGEVTPTIELPVFWAPWLMAMAFAVTAIVVTFHLIYPGREMVKQ